MMSSFEDQEQNPAEPVPDVATAAEPPQPSEPSHEDEALGAFLGEEEEEAQIDVSAGSDNETNRTEDPSSSAADSRTERIDRFSQTYVKYTKNLPIRRLLEIINTQIDHENNSLVFYCTSEELLRSFEDGMASQRKL